MFKSKNSVKENVAAVLWDFDGTIVDSMSKNFLVCNEIYPFIMPDNKKEDWPDALSSLDKYVKAEYDSINWRDLCAKHFGFSKKQIGQFQSLWGDLESKNNTPVKIIKGMSDVFQKIKLPHGICSQNCSKKIKNLLQKHEIDHHFTAVVGNNDVEKQKPHPEGFVYCVENMKIKSGVLFYIGDHKEDIMFANNAEIALKKLGYNFKVYSIIACYSGADTKFWNIHPDFEAYKPEDITKIILETRAVAQV